MAQAAESAFTGADDAGVVDLDALCHNLTLRALGRSVLGLDLAAHTDELAAALRISLEYTTVRASRPIRAPHWMPTPAQRRAKAAAKTLHERGAAILDNCRRDQTQDAPLVRALIDAKDPETGQPLSDKEICDELILFMTAGHDTTSTTLTYALWALGRHLDIQDTLAAEIARLGDRTPTPDDLPRLPYTVQVLHEALRLCPPAPSLSRRAVADVDIDGYRIPSGSWAVVGIYAMHRDPALWDNPLAFDPDRFSPERFAERTDARAVGRLRGRQNNKRLSEIHDQRWLNVASRFSTNAAMPSV